jgi:hypothetical protein
MFISESQVIVNKLSKITNQHQKRVFLKIKLLVTNIFKLITLFIKTFIFLLQNRCFPAKLDHIKYEVL